MSQLLAHGDARICAAAGVGTAAGAEPGGRCGYPVGNLGILEEKGLLAELIGEILSLHFIAIKI